MAETYTVAEAARVLKRTPKRVRQMLKEGKLAPVEGPPPVRIAAADVLAFRDTHRSKQPGPPRSTGLTYEQVLALIEAVSMKAIEAASGELKAALAVRDDAEGLLRQAISEERAGRLRAEAQAEELRARVKELEGSSRRKRKGKKGKKGKRKG